MSMDELVHNPSHYQSENGKDCWSEMVELFGVDAVAIFDCLNAYKYHFRAGRKKGNTAEQDMAKMENYMEHARKLMFENLSEKNVSSSQVYLIMQNILEESED